MFSLRAEDARANELSVSSRVKQAIDELLALAEGQHVSIPEHL